MSQRVVCLACNQIKELEVDPGEYIGQFITCPCPSEIQITPKYSTQMGWWIIGEDAELDPDGEVAIQAIRDVLNAAV